jgi:anti-sigma B factor antagonist
MSMLTIRIERKGSTTIVCCLGRIVVDKELSKLRDAVLCELDQQTIMLDLAAVKVMDAGGLGLLVFLHACAHGLGTALKLMNPTQRVAELLRLTNLDSVFEIYSSENVMSRHATVARATEDIRNVIVHEF